jgi:hypothetical protein
MYHCMTPCAFITVVLRFCSIIGVFAFFVFVLHACIENYEFCCGAVNTLALGTKR